VREREQKDCTCRSTGSDGLIGSDGMFKVEHYLVPHNYPPHLSQPFEKLQKWFEQGQQFS
jgi:hypothetical protein